MIFFRNDPDFPFAKDIFIPHIMRMNHAHSKSVNLSLDATLVAQARAFDLNLSKIARDAIHKAVRAEAAARWQADNAAAIASYNQRAEAQGLFSETLPGWWNGANDAV